MKRRRLLKTGISSVAVLSAGTVGWSVLNSPSASAFASLQEVVAFIERLPESSIIESRGEWNAFQIVTHLRQSINYSMTGFPEHKPEWFKATLGGLAFHLFALKGATTHGLSTPIPGARELEPLGNAMDALMQLKKDIQTLLLTKQLEPHFAYGALNKEQYELAQLFHINEHFTQLRFQQTALNP